MRTDGEGGVQIEIDGAARAWTVRLHLRPSQRVSVRRHTSGPAGHLSVIGEQCVGLHLEGVVLLLEKMCRNSYTFGEKMRKCVGIPTRLVQRMSGPLPTPLWKMCKNPYTFGENV